MSKIIVLGAGMVGSAMAIDLAKEHEVTSADLNQGALKALSENGIATTVCDISKKEAVTELIRDFDLVICAVPGFMGFETLKTIIEAGKNVADISFFPENSLDLHDLAKEKGVTALVDIGVAPGMDNIILGYWDTKMKVSDFECLVGGLPKKRVWPFEYKAPFSPIDVIEEYTRPARYVENSHIVTRPALSEPELIHFDEVGTLEAFNTDGLRSILFTMDHIPNMKEKTLRYPGHIKLIEALREGGFFSEELIKVEGTEMRTIDFTSKVLIDKWKLEPEEVEFTIMRVTVSGEENGRKRKVVYHLYDEYDPETKTSSMARTTGYTCTAAANLILERKFEDKGVFPPEIVGQNEECFNFIFEYLEKRGIVYRKEL